MGQQQKTFLRNLDISCISFINCSLDYAEMELNVTKTPWTKLEFKEKNDL